MVYIRQDSYCGKTYNQKLRIVHNVVSFYYSILSSLSLDVDECKSNPCGPNSNHTCENFQGYYKCKCGKGFFPDAKEVNCTGM